jgi:hypothetical protein
MRSTIDCSAEEITVGVTSHLAPGAPSHGGSEDRANDATAGQAWGSVGRGDSDAHRAGNFARVLRRPLDRTAPRDVQGRHGGRGRFYAPAALASALRAITPSRLAPRARGRREGWRGPRCSASVFAIAVSLCPRCAGLCQIVGAVTEPHAVWRAWAGVPAAAGTAHLPRNAVDPAFVWMVNCSRRRGISRTMPREARCERRLSNDEAAGQAE